VFRQSDLTEMLIAYWDIRNLRENIDLVADLLRREEPDLLILQNIANFDHSWTDPFTDYVDQQLFNSNTNSTNAKPPATSIPNASTAAHSSSQKTMFSIKANIAPPTPPTAMSCLPPPTDSASVS
jgi:hypothetical protein